MEAEELDKENEIKWLGDNEDLTPRSKGKWFRKPEFVDEKLVQIVNLSYRDNNFGRNVATLQIITDGRMGKLDISDELNDTLLQMFGNKVINIRGKKVYLKAVPFEGSDTLNSGYILTVRSYENVGSASTN